METSYLTVVEEVLSSCAGFDDRGAVDSSGPTWIEVGFDTLAQLQGWKIHVSASPITAKDVIRCCVPILSDERASFKVAASSEVLRRLVVGELGYSQVAKFLTVYPSTNDQAVRIVAEFVRLTEGFVGPPPPYDRVVVPNSIVSVRYGDFVGRTMQRDSGEIVPAMLDASGRLVFDDRTSSNVPSWVHDPFGVQPVGDSTLRHLNLGGSFVAVARVRAVPRGDLLVGIDLGRSEPCIIKTARPGAFAVDGSLASERILHEASILNSLWPEVGVPRVLDFGATPDGGAYLVTSDVGHHQLGSRLDGSRLNAGQPLDVGTTLILVDALAASLEKLAAMNVVHGDLNPSNVLVSDDFSEIILVDFEYGSTVGERPKDAGTAGFVAPQRLRGEPAAFSDDIFSLGALTYLALSGTPPTNPPINVRQGLSLHAPETVVGLVEACLSTVASRRPDAGAIRRTLAIVAPQEVPIGCQQSSSDEHLLAMVSEIYNGLVRRADVEGAQLRWVTNDPAVFGGVSLDMATGSAGTVFGLALLEGICPHFDSADILHRASLTLVDDWRRSRPRLKGNWVGAFGMARALLAAAEVLGDQYLEAAAYDILEPEAGCDTGPLDVYVGTAGQAVVLLDAWRSSRNSDYLNRARRIADRLVDRQDGRGLWASPSHEPGVFLGYAHGAAGIADVLLSLFRATKTDDYLRAATSTADALRAAARPLAAVEGGLAWPSIEGDETLSEPMWCHGATGIALFLLNYYRISRRRDIAETVVGAANAVAEARWLGPAVCHGMSSNAALLAAVAAELPDRLDPGKVDTVRGALIGSLDRANNGYFPILENKAWVTPELLNGSMGVAVMLAQLATQQGSLSSFMGVCDD